MEPTLTVSLGTRSYPIYIGEGTLAGLPGILRGADTRGPACIVTDTHVGPLYGEQVRTLVELAGLATSEYVFPAGEEQKRLAHIEAMCGRFLEAGMDRGSVVVALGGGVAGDMAGFAAACFMRGIRFMQIPTTIVAQVDSSVGGKTAVNHPLGKNTIGAFHQPFAVLIDMVLLDTLPERELRAGLAEVIKHGVIADESLFAHMETAHGAILARDRSALEVPVRRSCEIKADVVARDEREQGLRANLNYGHTFGHAFEAVTGYGRFLHGEAVALGMHAAGVLARGLGLVDGAFVERQRACIALYGLPVSWPELPVDEVLAAMKRDKKAVSGTMKFVVPDRMGHVTHRTEVPEDLVRGALAALRHGKGT